MSLIRRVRGQRARSQQVHSGVYSRPHLVPSPWYQPFALQACPPPKGAVLATSAIAGWFNSVGFFHGRSGESTPQCSNWGGDIAAFGGLYVTPDRAEAAQVAENIARNDSDGEGRYEVAWEVHRIELQAGDHLAVDEDLWQANRSDYAQRDQCLRRLDAGPSIAELQALPGATRWGAWGEVWSVHEDAKQAADALTLRWSSVIIRALMADSTLPPLNLRVWHTP